MQLRPRAAAGAAAATAARAADGAAAGAAARAAARLRMHTALGWVAKLEPRGSGSSRK